MKWYIEITIITVLASMLFELIVAIESKMATLRSMAEADFSCLISDGNAVKPPGHAYRQRYAGFKMTWPRHVNVAKPLLPSLFKHIIMRANRKSAR